MHCSHSATSWVFSNRRIQGGGGGSSSRLSPVFSLVLFFVWLFWARGSCPGAVGCPFPRLGALARHRPVRTVRVRSPVDFRVFVFVVLCWVLCCFFFARWIGRLLCVVQSPVGVGPVDTVMRIMIIIRWVLAWIGVFSAQLSRILLFFFLRFFSWRLFVTSWLVQCCALRHFRRNNPRKKKRKKNV